MAGRVDNRCPSCPFFVRSGQKGCCRHSGGVGVRLRELRDDGTNVADLGQVRTGKGRILEKTALGKTPYLCGFHGVEGRKGRLFILYI